MNTLKGLDQWPNVAVRKINEHLSESYTFGPDSPSIPCTATCPKCSLPLSKGMALENTMAGSDDGFGATLSQTGPAEIVECLKCPGCGHSVHSPHQPTPDPEKPVLETAGGVDGTIPSVNPEWITADYNFLSGEPTEWALFIRSHSPSGGIKDWTQGDMKAAFRAGYEAGRKA